MTTRVVTNQAELDAALVEPGITVVEIRSPRGAWLTIREVPDDRRAELRESSSAELRGSSSAVLRESSSAVLRESSSAVLRESSSAVLWESSSAVLWGSSSAVLWGSSSAELRESSSAVLRESSSAVLWGSSSAELWGSSSAELWGSSSAVLWDSSSAVLWESSSAVLRESSSAHAHDHSKVKASKHVAVHLHSANAVVDGGVLIDVTHAEDTPADWCDYHGVTVSKAGVATLYKAVNDQWTTQYGTDYSPGAKPSAPDWRDDNACGGGLHFSPSPREARQYHSAATRFVAVGVKVDDLRPIPGDVAKCKAPRVVRACVEVNIDGNPIGGE